MEATVDVRLQANCGCGLKLRVGDGQHFVPKDVVEASVKHSSLTGHKMEMFGKVTPPPKPVFISEQPREKRRYSDSDNHRR